MAKKMFDFVEYIKGWVVKINRRNGSPADTLDWDTDYASDGAGLVGTICDSDERRETLLNYLEIYREDDGALTYVIGGDEWSADESSGPLPTNAKDAKHLLEKYVWSIAKV